MVKFAISHIDVFFIRVLNPLTSEFELLHKSLTFSDIESIFLPKIFKN